MPTDGTQGQAASIGAVRSHRPRERKHQISASARELFVERGFHSVRMDDIAAATGITSRALYRHYKNKQALLSHVLFEEQSAFLAALPDLTAGYDPAGLDADMRRLASASLRHRYLVPLWYREGRHLDPADAARLRRRLTRFALDLAAVIRTRRPALTATAAEVRAWATIAIVNSQSEHARSIGDQTTVDILTTAALAVIDDDAGTDTREETSAGSHRRPQARREQLLSAAASIFRRHGFDGAGVDGLASETGMAGPAVYRYFDSKAAVLSALVTRFEEWVALETARALRSAADDADVLAAMVAGYVRVAAEAEDLLSVIITEAHLLYDDDAERLNRARADHLLEWRHWLKQRRPDLSETATQLAVRAARALIDDTIRIPRVAHRAGAVSAITRAATAVLYRTHDQLTATRLLDREAARKD